MSWLLVNDLDNKGDWFFIEFEDVALRRPQYTAAIHLTISSDGSKADTWSCGVVLYVLLAGFLPFQDENLMKMHSKVFKAKFEFPCWFSAESKRLISKLLVADPERRITIPAIMRDAWFRKEFTRPLAFSIEDESISDTIEDDESGAVSKNSTKQSSPKFFNAFEFISSMSSGFDLSSMFENKRKGRLSVMAEVFEVAPDTSGPTAGVVGGDAPILKIS